MSSRRSAGRHRRPAAPSSHAPVMVATVALTAAAVGGLHLTQAAGTIAGRGTAVSGAALPADLAGPQDLAGRSERLLEAREARRSSRGLVRTDASRLAAVTPAAAQVPSRPQRPSAQLLAVREVLAGQRAVRLAASAVYADSVRAAAARAAAGAAARTAHPASVSTTARAFSAANATANAPSGWVLPVSRYTLSAGFGATSRLWSRRHTGQDFAAAYGTPVRAVGSGVIVSAGWDGAFGQKIIVRHSDGTTTWYCHLSAFVVTGGTVRAGQVIGRVGSTGNSTGNHLHFEVHPGGGDAINPIPWLRSHGLSP